MDCKAPHTRLSMWPSCQSSPAPPSPSSRPAIGITPNLQTQIKVSSLAEDVVVVVVVMVMMMMVVVMVMVMVLVVVVMVMVMW